MVVPVTALCWAGSALGQPTLPVGLPADPRPTAQALDPRTPVPPAIYQSSLTGVQRGVDDVRLDWRRANDEVGQFKRGHIDLLKLEQPPAAGQPTGTAP
jgi:hypothetical protein